MWFPLAVQLRREGGEALLGAGLVGAALSVFESLELWDNLIVCYRLLDKRVQVRRCVSSLDVCTGARVRLACCLPAYV